MNYYKIRLGLAQINPIVGDFPYNRDKIIRYIKEGEEKGCDIIIFPEMAVTGYPAQDLIFVHKFVDHNLKIIDEIEKYVKKSTVIVGCITKADKKKYPLTPFYNSAAIIEPGGKVQYVHKHLLPNYDVFDEKRYFAPYDEFRVYDYKGLKIGIEICEDLWDEQYATKITKKLREKGACCIININASPYYKEKPLLREKVIQNHVNREKIPLVYLNMVGGQDEITFDGRSVVFDSFGNAVMRMPSFEESFDWIDLPIPSAQEIPALADRKVDINKHRLKNIPMNYEEEEEIFKALCLNLRDYFNKVGIFSKIVIGLSGGIDSSLTAAIACEAVGSDKVVGILMPSRFSSEHSIKDAVQLCKNLGMKYYIVPIKEIHRVCEEEFKKAFNISGFTLADENLQARLRGVILMYYSNRFKALLVSTGNKSEIAVGYCTLYGDTNGGKNVLGDLFKVEVYKVAKWINRKAEEEGRGEIIPHNCIIKPPSAELKENQKDQDTLPPYEILDAILVEFIENDRSFDEIINMGFDKETVRKIERMYYAAEYKRAQLVQTIKITKKSFGIGRRIPVINRYYLTREKL